MVVNGWHGDNPFYVMISMTDENVGIDLDESQWMQKHAEHLRKPSTWTLVHKETNHAMLAVIVRDGDQPYYTARHIGVVGGGGSNQITAYGIGVKRANGVTERLWLMPNGTVCGGDDVNDLGTAMIHFLGPRV